MRRNKSRGTRLTDAERFPNQPASSEFSKLSDGYLPKSGSALDPGISNSMYSLKSKGMFSMFRLI